MFASLLSYALSLSLILYPSSTPPAKNPHDNIRMGSTLELLFFFSFFFRARDACIYVYVDRVKKIDALVPISSTKHLLFDDKERVLQRHSSVFEFKAWAAACLAATLARHPRWKRDRAPAARSSVRIKFRSLARYGAPVSTGEESPRNLMVPYRYEGGVGEGKAKDREPRDVDVASIRHSRHSRYHSTSDV